MILTAKIRRRLRLSAAAVSLMTVLLASPGLAAAVADSPIKNGVTITPTQKELVLSSGLINANTQVVLTNRTGKDLAGTVRLVDFKTFSDTGGLSFAQAGVPTEKYGLANWMTLPGGDKISLPNGQTTTIPVVISNRFDLAPGGHYGAVVVTFGTDGSLGGNQTTFKQELVSLLFVTKHGGEDYGMQLQSFTPGDGSPVPTAATLRFKSVGNVHVVPRGYITVTTPQGKLLAKGTLNQASDLILPGTSKQFNTDLQTVSTAKNFTNYKITAYYRSDGQTDFTVKTIFINRLAWLKPVVITGVALLLVGIAGWLYWRRFTGKKRYAAQP